MSGRAIVADDQELSRVALAAVLSRRLAFESVVEVGSLDEALELLASDAAFDLALFDLVMPGMESAASISAVRECFPNVKVVVVSGSMRRQDILLALRSSAHGYIGKNSSVDEITSALRLVLDGHVYVPPSLSQPEPVGTSDVSGSDVQGCLEALTPRQGDVLRLLTEGGSNKEIARRLGLSEATVKVHTAAIYRLLGVHNRSGAAAIGARAFGNT